MCEVGAGTVCTESVVVNHQPMVKLCFVWSILIVCKLYKSYISGQSTYSNKHEQLHAINNHTFAMLSSMQLDYFTFFGAVKYCKVSSSWFGAELGLGFSPDYSSGVCPMFSIWISSGFSPGLVVCSLIKIPHTIHAIVNEMH